MFRCFHCGADTGLIIEWDRLYEGRYERRVLCLNRSACWVRWNRQNMVKR